MHTHTKRVSTLLLLSNNRIGEIYYFPPHYTQQFVYSRILRLQTTMGHWGNLIKSRLICNNQLLQFFNSRHMKENLRYNTNGYQILKDCHLKDNIIETVG